jgi:hypothetical protein
MKCSLCNSSSAFKLCSHGVCVSCRISGSCPGCESDAEVELAISKDIAATLFRAQFLAPSASRAEYSDDLSDLVPIRCSCGRNAGDCENYYNPDSPHGNLSA